MIYLDEYIKKYPASTSQDIIKLCYQAAFGAEHAICDVEAARRYFESEFEATEPRCGELYEMISHEICRVDIAAWKAAGLPSEWLFKMFLMTSPSRGREVLFEEYLREAETKFPYMAGNLRAYMAGGIRPVHHSEEYRNAYTPHYRIAGARFVRLLPIMQKITLTSAIAKIIAIDGRAASGKTTLAEDLSKITGGGIVHMDDFFLPPALRTPERLGEAGGNIHYERFSEEILPRLRSSAEFSYNIFDCSGMKLSGKRTVAASPIRIVEGSYSLHPHFGDYADIKVFSDISQESQAERILRRNGVEMAEMFRRRWIPMEETYFEVYSVREASQIVLNEELSHSPEQA